MSTTSIQNANKSSSSTFQPTPNGVRLKPNEDKQRTIIQLKEESPPKTPLPTSHSQPPQTTRTAKNVVQLSLKKTEPSPVNESDLSGLPRASESTVPMTQSVSESLQQQWRDSLHAAVKEGNLPEFNRLLKDAWYPISFQTTGIWILENMEKSKGGTPAIIQKLLADVQIQIEPWGEAISKAVEHDRDDILKILLEKPPILTAQGNCIETIQKILKKNLIRAAELGFVKSINCILMQGNHRKLLEKSFDEFRGLVVQAAAKTGKSLVIRDILLQGPIPASDLNLALQIAQGQARTDISDMLTASATSCCTIL